MRIKAISSLFLTLSLCLATTQSIAASRQQPKPEIFTDLLQCREIPDDKVRLACFDRQVAAMDGAAQRDEVVVLDKSELTKTRRTLFGFSFPKLPFLGDDDDKADTPEAEGLSEIEAKISAVKSMGYGKWLITLEDGAQWMTTEAVTGRDPKPGNMIEIKRGAIGSFLGRVEGGRAVRVKRVG